MSTTVKSIHIHKSIGGPTLEIIADKELLTGRKRAVSTRVIADGERLAEFLTQHLPGGTLDALVDSLITTHRRFPALMKALREGLDA